MSHHPEKNNDEFWRSKLTEEEFHILREKGTEPPFSGSALGETRAGQWLCKACEAPLFTSDQKFESSCGWPAFHSCQPKSISEHQDLSYNMRRIEVKCEHCGAHLGHVFNDGPRPTGLRYCINSLSLTFRPESAKGD